MRAPPNTSNLTKLLLLPNLIVGLWPTIPSNLRHFVNCLNGILLKLPFVSSNIFCTGWIMANLYRCWNVQIFINLFVQEMTKSIEICNASPCYKNCEMSNSATFESAVTQPYPRDWFNAEWRCLSQFWFTEMTLKYEWGLWTSVFRILVRIFVTQCNV